MNARDSSRILELFYGEEVRLSADRWRESPTRSPPLPEIGTALALFLNLAVDRPLHTETKDDPQIAKRSSSVIRKNLKKLIKKINK